MHMHGMECNLILPGDKQFVSSYMHICLGDNPRQQKFAERHEMCIHLTVLAKTSPNAGTIFQNTWLIKREYEIKLLASLLYVIFFFSFAHK